MVNESIETNSELTQMLNIADKDIKNSYYNCIMYVQKSRYLKC